MASARRIHARFTGQAGTIAHFGDSITVSQAYWAPLQGQVRNADLEAQAALRLLRRRTLPECWSQWRGAEYGSEGGRTVGWARERVAGWLRRLNPEMAVILFGTNDLPNLSPEQYGEDLRAVAQCCMDNGTVPLVTTVPPRHGFADKAAQFARQAARVAAALNVPLIPLHEAMTARRPRDWDGALPAFAAFRDYEVPTLISRDGVHPSNPAAHVADFSAEGLSRSGCTLRSYLTLLACAEVARTIDPAAVQPGDGPPERPWHPRPPAPPEAGARPAFSVDVSTVESLRRALRDAKPGLQIRIQPGLYRLDRPIEIRADGVTLRGAGTRGQVVLDGGGTLGELIQITACTGVAIESLTVQNVKWNGIKLNSETGVHRVAIRNCILHNIWQRAVKGVKVPGGLRERNAPSDCVVEYCLFYNDRPKRFEDDETDTAATFNGNYVGGIDVMFPRRWVIRGCVFTGIRGRTGEGRGAVFLWHEARDCRVERCVVVDCDSGICLGNSFRPPDVKEHAIGCVVENCFVTRAPENGILAAWTRDCVVRHSTVHDPESRLRRLVRAVHDNPGLLVVNCLLSGPPPSNETGPQAVFRTCAIGDFGALFASVAEGNLHLARPDPRIAGRAERIPEVGRDFDGAPRGIRPDIGADEIPE